MVRKSLAISLVLILLGCGDSSGPPGPEIVAIAAGNQQSGPAGGNPPLALRVRVAGSDNAPFRGASVTWQVISGGGSVSPSTATTDASGEASTVVTLGPPGTVQVRATVGSLSPVTFQLTSITPCQYLGPFTADTTVTGSLTANDCSEFGDGTFVDYYGLAQGSQQTLAITMRSGSLDAFLWLFDIAGFPVAVDDDGGGGTGGTDSRIKAVLRSGNWVVGANTFDNTIQFGPYTLSSAPTATTVAACEDVWLSGSVVLTETVSITDCAAPDPAGGTFYSDQFLIVLFTGQTVTFTQTSAAFDAYLSLYRDDGSFVADNDNAPGLGSDAQLTYSATQDDVYVLDAGTAVTGETGSYTLSVGAISGAPPAGASSLEPRPYKRLDLARPRLGRPLRRP